jgi:hypothetical protein
VQNRNIYTVEEGKSKDTKLRGLKGTSEDISISQEAETKGTRQNRVKGYKETPVHKLKGTLQNRVKRYEETPVPKLKGTLQDSVKRYKRNPSQTAHR